MTQPTKLSASRRKAVLIAKDVLNQLKAEKLKLAHAFFIGNQRLPVSGPLQLIADEAQELCSVCAKGAMLISYARQFNQVDCGDIREHPVETINKTLPTAFGRKNIDLIERVFEHSWWQRQEDGLACRIDAFCERALGPSRQSNDYRILAAICRNIIRNRGRFVLPKAKRAK